jgi:hypothetical protein
VDKSEEVFEIPLLPNQNPAVVLQPGEESLDLPPALVAAQLASILSGGLLAIALVRRNHLDVIFP